MASQVSPGVVIRERDFSNAVIVGASSIRAAIASSFRTGPVGKIVNIGSERELIDTFGSPAEANAADWLVASEFLRYGGQLAVVRAATAVKNAVSSGQTAKLIADKDAFDAAIRKSAPNAICIPPPQQRPCNTAITGTFNLRQPTLTRCAKLARQGKGFTSKRNACVGFPITDFTSNPEQKSSPDPVRITTRTCFCLAK